MSGGAPSSGGTQAPPNSAQLAKGRDWSSVRGFNYQPSYGSTGFELWERFDIETIRLELNRGKRHFPGMNALRWWHSWDAFQRDPLRYQANFEKTLQAADEIGCQVMPVLFNRFHSQPLDYGGIYIDHFLPGSVANIAGMFDSYMEAIVGEHAKDPRILAWDICNEPYWYWYRRMNSPVTPEVIVVPDTIVEAEDRWLKGLYARCKELGCNAPVTVGAAESHTPLHQVDAFADLFSIHPYWHPERDGAATKGLEAVRAAFLKRLDDNIAYAQARGKPILATEVCWGAFDDAVRAERGAYELQLLSERGVGFLAYVLHHSGVPDAHRPEFGPLDEVVGNLAFIEVDGSLRAGHDFFNRY